jgi:hypothetical protein
LQQLLTVNKQPGSANSAVTWDDVLLEDGVDEACVLHDLLHVLRPAAKLVLEPSHDERLQNSTSDMFTAAVEIAAAAADEGVSTQGVSQKRLLLYPSHDEGLQDSRGIHSSSSSSSSCRKHRQACKVMGVCWCWQRGPKCSWLLVPPRVA